MATTDVVVVGAGVSGLAFAWQAARAGRKVTVLEREPRAGGCLHSIRRDGFWYELGAHTLYNSYGTLLDILLTLGAALVHLPIREERPQRAGTAGATAT